MSGSITRELTRFFLYSKKGNKILLIITIAIILICFMKLGEVAAVEEVTDVNYQVRSYYDSVCNDAISRIESNWNNISENFKNILLNDATYKLYFYYGQLDGSSYENARPLTSNILNIIYFNNNLSPSSYTLLTTDYLGVTGYSMYKISNRSTYSLSGTTFNSSVNNVSVPLFVFTYKNANWTDYILAKKNNDIQTIIQIMQDIKAEQQEMSDYLQSDDTSEVDTSLPTESVEDPTEALWGDLFTSIRTAATSNTPQYVSITIPFINYSFTFSPVESSPMTQLRGKMKPLYDLIIASWWFGASLWIIRDIHKYLEDIKNGDITSRDNNIKTEVL